ncbi:MAG TPA: aldo/keto reductase, partial [Phenylobacterium sp.]|nr:aldo/keto reductase [Phenylobacterium sp.]
FGPDVANPNDARRTSFDFPPVELDRAWACVAEMRKIGEARGVSVARVALGYILQKAFTMSIIIGAKTLEQLDDNLAAVELTLTPEEIARLDEVSDLPSEYPGWMFARQGGGRRPKPFVKAS